MTDKLKPCPFCGCKTVRIFTNQNKSCHYDRVYRKLVYPKVTGYTVQCALCKVSFTKKRKDKVIKRWNTREYGGIKVINEQFSLDWVCGDY